MGDNINVDWNLAADQAATTGSMGQTAQQGALAGYELGQKQAQAHALQGYDGTPQSAAATSVGLVKGAAIDQADAMNTLSMNRQKASLYPKAIALAGNQLDQATADQAAQQPPAPPAAPPSAPGPAGPPAPTPGNFQFDPQNTLNIMKLAQNATGDLLSTPVMDRPAEAAQVKADMLKRGVPEPAIDAAMADLSDQGLQSLHAHYGAVVQHMDNAINGPKTPAGEQPAPAPNPDGSAADVQVTGGGLPKHVNPYPAAPAAPAGGGGAPASGAATTGAGAPTPFAQASAALTPGPPNSALNHPSNNWYNSENGYLAHPATIAANKWMASVGMPGVADLSGVAESLNAPTLNKQASLAYDPAITAATTQAGLPFRREELPLGDSGRKQLVTGEQAQEALDQHPGGYVGPSTEAQSFNAGTGAERAAAPFTPVTVPVSGRPQTMFKSQAMGASAAGMPGFGVGLTPGEQTSQAGDAKNLQDYVGRAPAQNQALQQEQVNGQKIAALAHAVPTGKYAQQLSDLSSTFTLPGKTSDLATNTGMLTQALASSFKDSLGGMAIPRLASEGNAITSAIPKVASQQDQIGLYGVGLTAAANYAKRQNDFIVDFAQKNPQTPSLGAAQAAWERGPGAGSFLSDPAFRNYRMANGQAAVQVRPDGKWGVFLPGTKQAFVFRAGP